MGGNETLHPWVVIYTALHSWMVNSTILPMDGKYNPPLVGVKYNHFTRGGKHNPPLVGCKYNPTVVGGTYNLQLVVVSATWAVQDSIMKASLESVRSSTTFLILKSFLTHGMSCHLYPRCNHVRNSEKRTGKDG